MNLTEDYILASKGCCASSNFYTR